MSDFAEAYGFEDVWRPIARPRRVSTPSVIGDGSRGGDWHARIARIASRAPEVMVKITGRTRDEAHLQAHLSYISRTGTLPLQGRDGEQLVGAAEVKEIGTDWAADNLLQRRNSPMSLSVVLSMPAGTAHSGVRDAACAFAAEIFGEDFDYVFALHTDADHPHVHIAVRMLGVNGARLNPRKADLDLWRQTFARLLRERDINAEATPRRARGVVLKSELMPLRKLGDRSQRDGTPLSRVAQAAQHEAASLARGELQLERPWEVSILKRQRMVRAAYLAAAVQLERTRDPRKRELAISLRAFLETMPPITTRRDERIRGAQSDIDLQQGLQAEALRASVDLDISLSR